jgi:tRNA U34 2-thiouridine synthase MnmA/TrmU
MHSPTRKAIALLSGGLDSALAARIVKDQGIEVVGLHLLSPFGCIEEVEKVAEELGIRLLMRDKGEAYLDLVQNPTFGYGKAINPCIDCRIYMFEIGERVMREEKAAFLVTGEVLGQRPMSQQKHSMDIIDKKSPVDRLVLRPLSAHRLAPTIPEEEGWVDREKLLGIWGRGRKDQLALAKEFGLTQHKSPGGGCLLTEQAFGKRLRDFFDNPTYRTSQERMAQSQMLRYGRHFRIADGIKIIVGRNQQENENLEKLWPQAGGTLFRPENFDGPSVIAFGDVRPYRQPIGAVIARYGKGAAGKTVFVDDRKETAVFPVEQSVSEAELEQMRI